MRNQHQQHKMNAYEIGQGWNAESEGADADEIPQGGTGHRRDAHTDWVMEEKFGKRASLLRCILHTGRTHQIRVHLKSIGHILLGDTVYSFKGRPPLPTIPRVMLHAERLSFIHPTTRKRLDFHAPLPADFVKVEKALRKMAAATKSSAVRGTARTALTQGYTSKPLTRRLGRATEE